MNLLKHLETVHLNQLTALGFLEKEKKGRKCYYIKKILHQPVASSLTSNKVMVLVMVSEQTSRESEDSEIQNLVLQRLSDLKDWRFERATILPK